MLMIAYARPGYKFRYMCVCVCVCVCVMCDVVDVVW